jgi:phosphoribosylaminoimidazole carboxylase (NCAIR synthetase)
VIAARSASGEVECFDVTENEHRDHILKVSRAPDRRSDRDRARLCRRARGRDVRA